MSAVEQHADQPVVESRSSVKIVRNAKGDVQIEVKVVAGDDPADVTAARKQATDLYNELHREYPR